MRRTVAAAFALLMAACGAEGGAPVPMGEKAPDTRHPVASVRRTFDDAPDDGVSWLARHQARDGGWDVGCSAETEVTDSPTITAQVLLACFARGYTNRGAHPLAQTVSRGLLRLKQHQAADGSFQRASGEATTLDHVLATAALVEAYGMTGSPSFSESAARGVEHLAMACRAGELGDAESAGWSLMLLQSLRATNRHARTGGRLRALPIDEATFADLDRWMDLPADAPRIDCAVRAIAHISFARAGTVDAEMDDLGRELVEARLTETPGQVMGCPLSECFAGWALRFARAETSKPWRGKTAEVLGGSQLGSKSGIALQGSWQSATFPLWLDRDPVRLTALCALLEAFTRLPYDRPRAVSYR